MAEHGPARFWQLFYCLIAPLLTTVPDICLCQATAANLDSWFWMHMLPKILALMNQPTSIPTTLLHGTTLVSTQHLGEKYHHGNGMCFHGTVSLWTHHIRYNNISFQQCTCHPAFQTFQKQQTTSFQSCGNRGLDSRWKQLCKVCIESGYV
jgi:hypothetical protein